MIFFFKIAVTMCAFNKYPFAVLICFVYQFHLLNLSQTASKLGYKCKLCILRHTNTHTHWHTDKLKHWLTDTQTHRHTDIQTHRHTDTPTHRHTASQTDTNCITINIFSCLEQLLKSSFYLCMENPSFEKKKTYTLFAPDFVLVILVAERVWKNNFKGFSNLVLKIACII